MREEQLRELAETRALRPEAIAEAAAARRRPPDRSRTGARSSSPPTTPPAACCAPASARSRWPTAATCSTGSCSPLSRPGVTGVLGTPDVIEDLLLLGALDGKIVFGSMNRGGLAGRRLGDRRPLHRLRRGGDRRRWASRAARCSLRIDLEDPATRGARSRPARRACPRARAAPAGRHGRAVHVAAPRRAHPQRPLAPRARCGRSAIAAGARRDLRLHLAEGAGRRRHGARGRRDDAADAAARRRGRQPTRTRPSRAGGRALAAAERASASSSGARCCTRPTTTSPPRSTPPPACSDERAGASSRAACCARTASSRSPPSRPAGGSAACACSTLAAGERRTFDTGDDELIVLPLAGACTVTRRRRALRARRAARACSPRSPTSPTRRATRAWRSTAAAGASRCPPRARDAPARAALRRRPPTCRSSCAAPASASRQVNNFCSAEAFEADRADRRRGAHARRQLVAPIRRTSTTRTCPGTRRRSRRSTTSRSPAAGSATSASTVRPDREIDVCAEVRSGDAIEMPRGYHGPSMAAPGYDLYYLNVMAGPGERAWRFTDDPAHAWIRDIVGRPGARPAGADDVGEEARMRLTVAQALVRFLACSTPSATASQQRLIAGCFGIFGHGNVAGVGQALLEEPDAMPFYHARNEQGDGARRGRLRAHEATGCRRSRARRRSARARRTWSPARRWRRSTGCRCCCCRATCSPRARPAPVLQELEDPTRATTSRSTTRCGRSRATGTAIERPGAARRRALLARDARADRPGRDRRGHALRCRRTCRPRRSTGPRSCSSGASGACAGPLPEPDVLAEAAGAAARRAHAR